MKPNAIPLADQVVALRSDLKHVDPAILSTRTGAHYRALEPGRGEFRLAFFGQEVIMPFPEFVARDAETGAELNVLQQALLAYHFTESDGAPRDYRWISFSELPDGAFYTRAFQSYTGRALARTFGEDMEALEAALRKTGGERLSFAGVSYAFQALPKMALMVACWPGDEDFPSSYRILFDAATPHHLATGNCAILGKVLTNLVIRNA
jgi:hypothetical protein